MLRLALAFADRLCDKYHNPVGWLIFFNKRVNTEVIPCPFYLEPETFKGHVFVTYRKMYLCRVLLKEHCKLFVCILFYSVSDTEYGHSILPEDLTVHNGINCITNIPK